MPFKIKIFFISTMLGVLFLINYASAQVVTLNLFDPPLTYTEITAFGLKDGDMIRANDPSDPDVYIINRRGFKRLFLNPAIFDMYGHLGGWDNVKIVTPEIRDAFETSTLFRNCEIEEGYNKVYTVEPTGEDEGTLHWLDIEESKADIETNFWHKIFCINLNEFSWYKLGDIYNSASKIPVYRREDGITSVKTPLEELKKWASKNGVNVYAMEREVDNLLFTSYERVADFEHYDALRDGIQLEEMPRLKDFMSSMNKLPPHLESMLQGEYFYFTTKKCRSGYVRRLDYFIDQGVHNTKKIYVPGGIYPTWGGITLEPSVMLLCSLLSEYVTLHEIGHLVDSNGIQYGKGRDFLFKNTDTGIRDLYDEYFKLFEINPSKLFQEGKSAFLTSYAQTDTEENFAEHFSFYIVFPDEFREKAKLNPVLAEKYEFLKKEIFQGIEY